MADLSARRESVLRDYLYEHPELLFDVPITSKQREFCVDGKFVDLLFEVQGVHYIVELKRDSITREAVGQVMEYYGRLRQSHASRTYRMVLAAPSIPKYRSLPLEEFGIRCVEVPFPESFQPAAIERQEHVAANSVRNVLRHMETVGKPLAMPRTSVSLDELLPPTDANTLSIVHELLLAALPEVQKAFSEFEILPVRINRTNHPDVLCLSLSQNPEELTFTKGGAWWAFAFGKSEQLPKNDTPNISVNSLPWGLDFAINAELRTSQKVMLDRVKTQTARFDELVKLHGKLSLQLWMKFEHQPRFYYWVPVSLRSVGSWNGKSFLEEYASLQAVYPKLREEWMQRIVQEDVSLTPSQKAHMLRRSNDMNLAMRLARTIGPSDTAWAQPYEQLTTAFTAEYLALKPLIQFFN